MTNITSIAFDALELELIAVAVDRYRHTLKRERQNVKRLLKKLTPLLQRDDGLILESTQEITRLEGDLTICKHIAGKLGGVV